MPPRRTTILADADLLDRVERLAHRRRTTKTALIASALEAYLDLHEDAADLPFLAVGRSANGRLSLDGRPIVRRDAGRRSPESRPRGG